LSGRIRIVVQTDFQKNRSPMLKLILLFQKARDKKIAPTFAVGAKRETRIVSPTYERS
jgi:hypothetical protein